MFFLQRILMARADCVHVAQCICFMLEMHDIDLPSLRCLVALLDLRSVTRAAERLGLTQPTVSHSLARLRKHFGDPLLVRGRGEMIPTSRALALYDIARSALHSIDRLSVAPGAFRPEHERSTFVLTIADYFEAVLAPRLFAKLRQVAPGVRIELRPPNPTAVRTMLESGEVDLRIGWVHDPWPELRFAKLFEDRFVCLARRGHPTIGQRLRLKDFFDLDHIRPAAALRATGPDADVGLLTLEQYLGLPTSPGRQRTRARASSAASPDAQAARRIRVAMVAQSFLTLLWIVANSDAIATVPARLARTIGRELPLRVFAPPLAMPSLRGALYWHERTNHEPRQRWFRAPVSELARDLRVTPP